MNLHSKKPKSLAILSIVAFVLASGIFSPLGAASRDHAKFVLPPPSPPGAPVNLPDGAVALTKFAVGLHPIEAVDTLPPPGNQSRVVFLKTDNKLYRDTGTAWTSRVAAADLEGQIVSGQIADGAIGSTKLASNVKFIEASQTLPTAGQNGRVALQMSDHKLYIDDGTMWQLVTGVASGSSVTLPIQSGNIADGAITLSKFAAGLRPVEVVSVLPASGTPGRLVYRTTDKQLLVDDGSSWTSVTAAASGSFPVDTAEITDGAVTTVKLADGAVGLVKVPDGLFTADATGRAKFEDGFVLTPLLADGAVTAPKLGPGIGFVQTLAALPAAGTAGRLVFLTTDNKLYRDTGLAWTTTVATADLDGLIQTGQLADANVTAGKIADGAIALAKLPDAVFSADAAGRAKFAAGFIDAALLQDGVISAVKLADGSVLLAKLPDGVFTADAAGRAKFAASFVDAGLLQDGSVTSAKLADAAVTTAKLADGSIVLVKIADATFTADAAGRAKFAPGFVDTGLLANFSVTASKLDPAIGYIETLAGLPSASRQGRVVFNTIDNKLYRDTGIAWIAAMDAVDVAAATWNPNNDGAGSGLDADLLDGLDSAKFLRSDQSGTLAGNLTVNGNIAARRANALVPSATTVTYKSVSYTIAASAVWSENGHVYIRVEKTNTLTWEIARGIARTLGGYLVTITSADEQAFIVANVKSGTLECRIGNTDAITEGNFQWVTGELAVNGEGSQYSNWSPGEPSNSAGAEDTGTMGVTATWNDVSATSTRDCALVEISLMDSGG
jgi:hypothetical protein